MAVTLAQMTAAAKDLCDFVNNPLVGTPTWTQWINDGIEKLYRIVAKRKVGVFQTFSDVTLTSATNLIPKPSGYRGLIGVTLDPTSPSMRRSLPKYTMGERDSLGLLGPRSYHVVGQNISIEPFQLCAGNYRVHFIGGPTVLASDSETIDAVLEPYDDYVTTWAAIRALGKEESDNRGLYADLKDIATDVDEFFALMDGDDPSTIVDDEMRGPVYFYAP